MVDRFILKLFNVFILIILIFPVLKSLPSILRLVVRTLKKLGFIRGIVKMAALYKAKYATCGSCGRMGLPERTLLLESAVHSTDEWFKRRLIQDLKLPRRLNLMNFFSPSDKWGSPRNASAWLHRMAPSGEGITGYHVGVRSYIFI
jgi:hypothetical protein